MSLEPRTPDSRTRYHFFPTHPWPHFGPSGWIFRCVCVCMRFQLLTLILCLDVFAVINISDRLMWQRCFSLCQAGDNLMIVLSTSVFNDYTYLLDSIIISTMPVAHTPEMKLQEQSITLTGIIGHYYQISSTVL